MSIDNATPAEWDALRYHKQPVRDPNVAAVISKYEKRAAEGMKKYGVTTERNDISFVQWITHLQEELMDATIYCERIKRELV